MNADMINGSFEALAALFIFNHCLALFRDKAVKGVSIISTIFFFTWGVWNLYYYPSLDQPWSFYGGMFVSAANASWIGMMIYYSQIIAKEQS